MHDWLLGMDVEYHAALPAGPKIIAANHPTTTDPFFLMTVVSEQMSILVTELAFEVPVFGDYLRAAQHIPVILAKAALAFEQARRRLVTGRTIGIFPEGALSPLAGGLGFHPGAYRGGASGSEYGRAHHPGGRLSRSRRAFTTARVQAGRQVGHGALVSFPARTRSRWARRSIWMERSTIAPTCGLRRSM